ncbi:MAG: VOC family protein [Thioalkalispiraceae bacterium]
MNSSKPRPAFHLAFPVHDLVAAEAFYCEVLGCKTGRRDKHWIDFNFYGHQIVAHRTKIADPKQENLVDNKKVPVPHFGIILDWPEWEAVAKNLIKINVKFDIDPYIRFKGQKGEQATMFFRDPSGNAIEIKAFRDQNQIFEK